MLSMSLDPLYKPHEKFQDILAHRTEEEQSQRDKMLNSQMVQAQARRSGRTSAYRNGVKKLFYKDTPKPIHDVTDQVKTAQLNKVCMDPLQLQKNGGLPAEARDASPNVPIVSFDATEIELGMPS